MLSEPKLADQQLLEADTPSQVLVLSGVTQAASLTFSDGFLLIRSRVALRVKCHTMQHEQFSAGVSFHFVSLAFSLLPRLCRDRRRDLERED